MVSMDPARRPASAMELAVGLEATGLGRGPGAGYRLDTAPADAAPEFAHEVTLAAGPEPVTYADAPAARNRGDGS